MAIARGAGTEIIRCHSFETINDTVRTLIIGEQHHIYTVLSIVCMAQSVSASGNLLTCYLQSYDANAGTTAQNHLLFKQAMSSNDTFIFNDKYSFNGFEPTDFTGPMDDATKQNAIADQGSSVAQKLWIHSANTADSIDVICTFIDQNNS